MRKYEGTTRLQGIGIVEGIKAKNLRVGDRRVWNFGKSSEIVRIEPSKTGKTLKVTTLWFNDCARLENGEWVGEWQEDTRTLKADTIVVVKELNPVEEVKVEETNEVEEIMVEAKEVIEGLKDMDVAEAVKVVDETLDKIDVIINTIEEDEKRWELRDMENHLKWVYGSLEEMAAAEETEEKEEVERKAAPQIIEGATVYNLDLSIEKKFKAVYNMELRKGDEITITFNDGQVETVEVEVVGFKRHKTGSGRTIDRFYIEDSIGYCWNVYTATTIRVDHRNPKGQEVFTFEQLKSTMELLLEKEKVTK